MRERGMMSRFLNKRQSAYVLLAMMILVAFILVAQAHGSKTISNASGGVYSPVQIVRFSYLMVPDFGISPSPITVTALVGATGTDRITTTPTGGVTGIVTPASPTIATSLQAATVTVGGSVFDTSTISGSATGAGGTVSYLVFLNSVCTAPSSTASTVTVTNGVVPNSRAVLFNSTGTASFQAVYSGDANNAGATSACEPLTVNKTNPTIATTLSATTITVGGSVSDSSALTGSFQAGGTLTYNLFSGSTCVETATVISTVTVTGGVVPSSASHSFTTAGAFSWNAVYSGDANNNGAASPCEPLTVNKAIPTIATTLSATTITVGGSVSDSSVLTNSFQAGGTVAYEFFSGSTCTGSATTVGTPVTVTNSIVPNSAAQTFNSAGSFSWNAIYSGDANNNGATSPCEPLTVSKASPSIATTVSAATSTVGTGVHDSTTLTSGFQAAGTVIYTLFANSACTGTGSTVSTVTVTNGVVPDSTSVTPTPAGSYAFQASYSGDANNNGIISICEPFTVQDFSIAASDPNPANLGNPASSAVTVIGQNGFKDSVSLSVTFPSGLSCSLTPTTVTPPDSPGSNLSCTSTIAGSFSVTVSGSSGQVLHSKTITVTFGDYTITATPPAVNVQSGTKNATIITLVNNGYNGPVALSLTGPVITGLSLGVDPPALTLVPGQSPTTTITILTTSSTPAGNYPVSIRTDSIVPRTLTITVTVEGNFTMTLAKSRMVVTDGGSANTNVTLSSFGISGVVTIYAVPPANSGVQGRFNPPLVLLTPGFTSSTVLTIDASTVVSPGVYNVTLVGQSGNVQRLIYLNLNVSDFSILINPNPISIPPGQVGNTTVYVHGLFSFNGTINLVTYPLRQIQPSLLPNSIVLNSTSPLLYSTLTIRVQGSTLPGLYNIRVTGTVGRLVHTVILKLSVVEFSINITPSIILQVGQSLTIPLTITSQNGFTDTVDLNFTVPADSGLTGQISPTSVGLLPNATSPATLTLTGSRPGAYRMNITGTSTSGIARSFQYVTVYIGDFTISSSAPSIVIPIGAARTIQLDMGSHFFFSGTITLIVTSDPSGLDISNLGTVTVAPARTAAITVTISTRHAISGVYNVTVTGTSGPLSHALFLRVIVAAPPLLTVPALQTVNQGSLLTFFVSATDSDSSLTISYTTLAPGATTTSPTLPPGATFYPSYRTNSTDTIVTGIFNWKPSSSQTPGDYVITFTAQDRNGGVTSRQVTVHVNGAVNRSITLPSSPIVWYSLIAVIGIAGTLAGSRIWRNRNVRKAAHEDDFHGALGVHGGTSKAEQ